MIVNRGYSVDPIHNVKPHPRNARRGDLEAIEASIAANGFFGAIVVQESSGLILIGNHRWRAAVRHGMTEIPVIRVACSDAQAVRMALADNRTSDLGTNDPEILVAQLAELAATDAGIDGTGYTDETFAALEAELADLAKQAAKDAGEPPTPSRSTGGDGDEGEDLESLIIPSEPITAKGDLWLLGEHRLLCGDTFDEANRRRVFRGQAADLVMMDPPYAIYGSSTGIGADIADDKMVRPFFEQLFRICQSHVREFAHVYTCCDWRSWSAIWESAKAANLSPKNCLIWDKGSSGLGSNYANTYEMIGFFARLPPATAMKSTTRRGQRTVHAPNVARHNRVVGAERLHNAAKPVALFEWLIGNSSDPGELVVDFFGGSGTTIVACEKTNRRALTFEMERKYCDIIVARWERLTGKRAKRVPIEDQEAPAETKRQRKEREVAEAAEAKRREAAAVAGPDSLPPPAADGESPAAP